MIEHHPIYTNLGSNKNDRLEAYRELFRDHIDENIIHEIRASLNHELVFGRSYFKDKIEEITQRQTRLGQAGRPKVEDEAAEYYVS